MLRRTPAEEIKRIMAMDRDAMNETEKEIWRQECLRSVNETTQRVESMMISSQETQKKIEASLQKEQELQDRY